MNLYLYIRRYNQLRTEKQSMSANIVTYELRRALRREP